MSDFILIKRKNLEKILDDAHKWRAIENCSDVLGELKPEELDAIILEYCEDSGLFFPEYFSGRDALDVLVFFDTKNYNEVMGYDKRKND